MTQLTKLPQPISIHYCPKCDDVMQLREDRSGLYCSGCFLALSDIRKRYCGS